MLHRNNILFSLLLAALVHGEYIPSLKGTQILSITCRTTEDISYIRSFIDNPNYNFLKFTKLINEPIDVLVAKNELFNFKNILNKRNIDFNVVDGDVELTVQQEKYINNLARSRSPITKYQDFNNTFDYYPRYNEIVQYLKDNVQNNRKIAKLEVFGNTTEGRALYVVKISSGGVNKPTILIDAGIHAREWIAPTTALHAINQLLNNKSNAELYENVNWYIIPSLNPDGYEFSHSDYRFWRKTRSPINGSFCVGTDANRNFDFKWMTVGASASPCSEIYAGYKPFSEPETQALRDFIMANKNTIKVYLTVHSYGQYILHPWGYTSDLPTNEPELRKFGLQAANAIAQMYNTRYVVGATTNVLYAAAGGSDDWAMGVGGANLSYTIELPGGRFDPPPSKIVPVAIETFEAFKVFHTYVKAKFT